jgi:hypothetical protein
LATQKHILCPSCRFPNQAAASHCLTCKAPLHRDEPITENFRLPKREGSTPASTTRARVAPEHGLAESMLRRTVAWLLCDPFDPLPLGTAPIVSIGRSKTCDVVLPHSGVSRTHAVIRVIGRQLVIEDRSTFGTFVDGQRMSSGEVRPGQRISIGPYELRIAPIAEESDEEGTKQIPRAQDPGTMMSGRLENVPPIEILQGFEFHRKTGTLYVTAADGEDGFIAVKDGRVAAARIGTCTDEEAVLAIALLERGMFSVVSQVDTTTVGRNLRASLTELLLEANRRRDELRRTEV